MRKFLLSMFGSSALAALMLYGLLSVAPVVRASVACSVPFIFTNGTTADATQVNANFNSLVNCFASAASAGVNNDITALNALSTPISPAQGGTQNFWGGTSSGTNTITVTTVTPASGFSFASGNRVCFTAGGTNTGPTTLNVNGTGAKPFDRRIQGATGVFGTGTMVGGELVNGQNSVCALVSSTIYILENQLDYVGEIKDFGFAGCPAGWAETNGVNNVYSTASFPDITAAFGTTWGTNAGFTVMPDLRGRATFSRDGTGTRLTTDQSGALAGNTVGTVGGLQNQTLVAGQLPPITPTFTGNAATLTGSFSGTQVVNFGLNQAGIIQITGGSFIGGNSYTPQASAFILPTAQNPGGQFSSITPNFTYTPAGSIAMNSYTPAGTISSFGSGASHPVTPPLGIVTKCVKL